MISRIAYKYIFIKRFITFSCTWSSCAEPGIFLSNWFICHCSLVPIMSRLLPGVIFAAPLWMLPVLEMSRANFCHGMNKARLYIYPSKNKCGMCRINADDTRIRRFSWNTIKYMLYYLPFYNCYNWVLFAKIQLEFHIFYTVKIRSCIKLVKYNTCHAESVWGSINMFPLFYDFPTLRRHREWKK